MASLSSESDSNTFAECHLSYYSFSLTTDILRVSKNPQVPAVQRVDYLGYGVRVHSIIRLAFCQFSLRHQTMATLKEGDRLQMWEFIRI